MESVIVLSSLLFEFQVIPDQENHQIGGHCLTSIYFFLYFSELNIKIFIKYSRSVLNKLTFTKK